MSRFQPEPSARRPPSTRVGEAPRRPRPGPSVYESREPAGRRSVGWLTIAEPNPWTGELEWLPDWGPRVQGWMPLDELLRRGELGG
jgi:hypothetical protein